MNPLGTAFKLSVLSLRYSSWSMRAWLVLKQACANFEAETVSLPHMMDPSRVPPSVNERKELGSVHGLFPVLHVSMGDGGSTTTTSIHESLAICEYVADIYPKAHLWPTDPLERARARAICCEMVSGFSGIRSQLSCHMMARVPADKMVLKPDTLNDIDRVFDIWTEALKRSGGPFLFGEHFGIADAMYYPVLTRFRTYNIDWPKDAAGDLLKKYAKAVESAPAVINLVKLAQSEPSIPVYDQYIRDLGGDPEAKMK